MASQSESGFHDFDAAAEAGAWQLAHERGMLQAAMAAGKAEAQPAGARSDAMEQAGRAQLTFEQAAFVSAKRAENPRFDAKKWFLGHAQDVHNREVAARVERTRSAVENVGREPAPQPVMMDHRLIDFLRQHAQHHASVPGDDGPIH